jgi:Flp pilus assembly pilin Flp
VAAGEQFLLKCGAYGASGAHPRANEYGVGNTRKMFQCFWRDQGGASLIEYSILVALITVLVVLAVAVASAWAQGMWAHLLPLLG